MNMDRLAVIDRGGVPHVRCTCGRVVAPDMINEREGVCDACIGTIRRKLGKSRREFERERQK
jgi:hypothetical protein